MVDSGSGGLHVSTNLVKELRLRTKNKQRKYEVNVAGGSYLTTVSREITPIRLRIGRHSERIAMDVMELAYCDIILGRPWLKKHNPNINWISDDIDFNGCSCSLAAEPGDCRTDPDERQLNLMSTVPASKTDASTGAPRSGHDRL